MYALQWKINNKNTSEILNENELNEYKNLLQEILGQIEDFIILEPRNLSKVFKKNALDLKYNKTVE